MAPVRAGLARLPPIAGAVLAGGASSRFGSDKALAPTPDGPLAARVTGAMRRAGLDPVVLIGASAAVSAELSVPTVPDRMPDSGPLAGLGTALAWAAGVNRVVVLPCDLPLVTEAMIRSLVDASDNLCAAVARIDGQVNPIIGCWPITRSGAVNALLRAGERRMTSALDTGPFIAIDLDPVTSADADDPAELQRLLDGSECP